MWTDLGQHQPDELSAFDGVYLGGGNTFHLLAQLQDTGFDRALRAFALRGGAVYGGSAGAIVLSRDIRTCAHLDSNDVGLTDTRGLNLLNNYAIWCHYTAADDQLIYGYLRAQSIPVLALSEQSGICVEDERLVVLGYQGAYRFSVDGKEAIDVGELIHNIDENEERPR